MRSGSTKILHGGRLASGLVAATLLVLLLAAPAMALPGPGSRGPTKIGEEFPLLRDTPHPLPLAKAGEAAWSDLVSLPGATYIRVHFSQLRLAPGEKLIVRTPDGLHSYELDHTVRVDPRRGFWAPHVPGDSCEVRLISNGEQAGHGYTIDRFGAGYPTAVPEPPTVPELICGTNDTENIRCYEVSEPDIYAKAKAVARLMIGGSSACTGWLVGNSGHLMTNNHCWEDQAGTDTVDFEFMAEGATCATNCNSWGACPGTVYTGTATFVQTSVPYDYTLVQLDDPTQLTAYGFLTLRPTGAVLGERAYIVGHPAAYGKKGIVNSTYPDDVAVDGKGHINTLDEPNCQLGTPTPEEAGYYMDSEGGQSGSPVLGYSDHQVVALHHCAGGATCPPPNRGVKIQYVIADLGENLPPGAIEGKFPAMVSDSFVDTCPRGFGDEDGTIDPGEDVSLTVELQNLGSDGMTNVSATLSTTTTGVTIGTATSTYPDLPAGGAAFPNNTALTFSVGLDVPCGTFIDLLLTVTDGVDAWEHHLRYRMGTATGTPFLTEGFEDAWPPAGWGLYQTTDVGSPGWERGTSASGLISDGPHTGTYMAWHDDDSYSADAEDWLVTPEITVPVGGAVLRFWENEYYGSYATYHGIYWIDTQDPNTATDWVEVAGLEIPANDAWVQTSVDLSALAGQTGYLAFVYVGDFSDEWYVDDVELVPFVCNPCYFTETLTVVPGGTGTGTVTSDPAGIDCGLTCVAEMPRDFDVTLHGVAAPGSRFAGFSGEGCTGTDDCTVNMSAARTVNATFELVFPLHVTKTGGSGTGVVTSAPAGIDCGLVCDFSFDTGTVVTLSAVADPLSTFMGWSGDCTGTDPCVVTMDVAHTVNARFVYGMLVPAEMRIDPAPPAEVLGNTILEPGDTVTFHPAWTNPAPEAHASATGALSNFHDNFGGTWPITGAAAFYGIIPGETTTDARAATGFAYTLNLPVPAPRPATHWDVFVDEAISTEETHTWTIHVGASFPDVPTTYSLYSYVETLLHSGVTAGCGSGVNFCPGSRVTRAQMAMFIARAQAGSDLDIPVAGNVDGTPYNCVGDVTGISLFTDVAPGALYCKHVHYVASTHVTTGCGDGTRYCPTNDVSRGAMAIFIARAMTGGEANVPLFYQDPVTLRVYSCDPANKALHFTDVTTAQSWCRHTHYLWATGTIDGCASDPARYCPTNMVNRGQMSKFLVNSFHFSLGTP